MTDGEKIRELCSWISSRHFERADGCKSSCRVRGVTYHHSDDEPPYWSCEFGGYCFGDLARHQRFEAKTLDELVLQVKTAIMRAIEKEDHEAQEKLALEEPPDDDRLSRDLRDLAEKRRGG